MTPQVLRWACGTVLGASVLATSAIAQERGELLYSTHCGACHAEQIHWRDGSVVTDWTRLVTEVRKWQATASLAWSEDDVLLVARHLNNSVYRFPTPLAGANPPTFQK